MSGAPSSDAGFSASLISVRIVDIGYYMMPLDKYSPAVAFQAARLTLREAHSVPKLPTIRIFGRTPAGQRVCVHLHGRRPYFYVPLPREVPIGGAVEFSRKLMAVLNQALSSSLATAMHAQGSVAPDHDASTTTPAVALIADIEPVVKTGIYGYRPRPSVFLRISLYNPRFVGRLATILHTREGLPKEFARFEFQPYESHMPFPLQTMTDLALTGMGFLNLVSCKFRLPLPPDPPGASGQDVPSSQKNLLGSSPSNRLFSEKLLAARPDLFWSFGSAERRSGCDIELDAFADDVLNCVNASQGVLPGQKDGSDGYAAKTLRVLWDEERARIGRKPVVLPELPRAVVASHELSDAPLAVRLRLVLDTASRQHLSHSEEESPIGSLEDVLQFLDSEVTVARASTASRPVEEGVLDDSSASEQNDEESAIEWEDIHACTQLERSSIPQGDGSGTDKKTRKSRSGSGQRSYRRRHRRGSYQELEFRATRDMRSELSEGEGTTGEKACVATGPAQSSTVGKHAGSSSGSQNPIRTESSAMKRLRFAPGHEVLQDEEMSEQGASRKRVGLPSAQKDKKDLVNEADSFLPLNTRFRDGVGGSGIEDASGFCEPGRKMMHSPHPRFAGLSSGTVAPPSASRLMERNVNELGCGNSGEGNVVTLVPAKPAPSKSDMLLEFGVGRNLTTLQHRCAFYSKASDNVGRSVTGVTARMGRGGVEGLVKMGTSFVSDDRPSAPLLSTCVAFVRTPPPRSVVVQESRLFTRYNSLSGKKHGTKQTRIDAAGRVVGVCQARNLEDSTPATFLSDEVNIVHSRRIARRVDQSDVRDASSDESEGGRTLSASDVVKVSTRVNVEEAILSDRPASPKYDERSFFPDNPWKRRSRSMQLGPEDSPIYQNSTTPVERQCSARAGKNGHESTGFDSGQCLTVAALEIIASCHARRLPNPAIDPVLAICIYARRERTALEQAAENERVFAFNQSGPWRGLTQDIVQFSSEERLLDAVAAHLSDIDPDVVCGFEVQTMSIGYLLERAEVIGHDLEKQLSRFFGMDRKPFSALRASNGDGDENPGARYFKRKGVNVKVCGRHILNVWRVVRKDVKLGSYSLEGVAEAVLNVVLPKHECHVLEGWLLACRYRDRALYHLRERTRICMAVIDKLDILGRTAELARVYGIEFMSVLTRGSQYRVESMLARVAHPRGFVLLAAQRDQVFNQPAVECIPLVMEPKSAFYVDPVIVLDFQSLYPSMVIAHNLCFSTMLGNINRMARWGDEQQLGVVKAYQCPSVEVLSDEFGGAVHSGVFCAPNGDMFVTEKHRRGVLPQMLHEVLQTRVMVKGVMKSISRSGAGMEDLMKQLNARQFATKMLANVTYGFAAASATGRMPCAGLADAIVQCGRDALERMITFVDTEVREGAGARVVYGDTDSLFVVVPGATLSEAFAVGRQITAKAEAMFPTPIKLQLEKVFSPCILVTKKRYVGYAYESEECTIPVFDAKGIETVRRDSCGIVQKTMERCLRMLFELRDMSKVKGLFQRVCNRIHRNGIPVSEFIFRKEVRLGTYKKTLPPAAVVASRAVEADPRAAPRHGERVAFVVLFAGPGSTLNESVMAPGEMLIAEAAGKARLHSTYYITKQLVPSLNRLFCLTGANVASWYAELPRPSFEALGVATNSRIPSYFAATRPCVVCRAHFAKNGLCEDCRCDPQSRQAASFLISARQRANEKHLARLNAACVLCIGRCERDVLAIECISLDCRVRFVRHRLALQDARAVLESL